MTLAAKVATSAALASVLLLTTGCAVGPDYHAPLVATPPAFTNLQRSASPMVAESADDMKRWWAGFGDAELNRLTERALADNLDLKSAASRIIQARQQVLIVRARTRPKLNLGGNASHADISKNYPLLSSLTSLEVGSAGGASSVAGLPGFSFNSYQVGLDASWEIDLFGGTRRAAEAARADVDASVWSERDTQVSLVAEIAHHYLMLRTAQVRVALLEAQLRDRQSTLGVVEARAGAGYVTALDVRQQEVQVSDVQAELPALQADALAEIHAIAILLAQTPESLESELSFLGVMPPAAPVVPTLLPSELLRRRPDVRVAERRLAAATARVGVQVADLYPKFNLTGAADLVSGSLGNLFSLSSRQTNAGGAISLPLFDGGKTRAAILVANEDERQALYAYQRTVLIGLGEVEDALVRYDAEQQRRAALQRSVTAAAAAVATASDQYRSGLGSFVNVLDTQRTLLAAQDQLAQSDGVRKEALVTLYKALGGGWQ